VGELEELLLESEYELREEYFLIEEDLFFVPEILELGLETGKELRLPYDLISLPELLLLEKEEDGCVCAFRELAIPFEG
jgi:hypothetical protein